MNEIRQIKAPKKSEEERGRIIIKATLSKKIVSVLGFAGCGLFVILIILLSHHLIASSGLRAVEVAYLLGSICAFCWLVKRIFQGSTRLLRHYSLEEVLRQLKDSETDNRKWAVNQLKKLKWVPKTEDQRIDYLIACKKWDQLIPLGSKTTTSLVPALYWDWDHDEADRIISALKEIKDHSAVKPLIEFLKHEKSFTHRGSVRNALRELTGKDFGKDYNRWYKWLNEQEDLQNQSPIRNAGYRDREEPHSSPLPHHAAYGSVLRDSADQAESDPGEQKTE